MKKILFVLITLCLILSGCSTKRSDEQNPQVNQANATFDYVEYNNVESMNNVLGTNIVTAAIAGKSNEKFGIIAKTVAEYRFTANDEDWCIRASKDLDNDISGLYYDNISFEKDTEATYYNDDVYMHRFFHDGTQYVITLKVKDKDISTSHFDEISAELQTNITGVQAGYRNEIIEDGDTVVYKVVMFNADGTTTTSETFYKFDGDKMVSIINKATFVTDEVAKEYLQTLIDAGNNADKYVLEGNTLSVDMSENVDFYESMTKADFISQMRSSIE